MNNVVRNNSAGFLALPAILVVTIFLFIPFAVIFQNSMTIPSEGGFAWSVKNYTTILGDSFYWEIIIRTLRISLITTAAALLLGYPAAMYLYFSKSRWRRVFLFVVVSPLFISVIVRTYGWLIIFAPSGALNAMLPEALQFPIYKTETAIVIGLMHIYIPFMVLALNASMAKIDGRFLSAAYSLGASRVMAFRDIMLPLSRPGILSGTIVVFSVSMTAFSTPVLLGGSSNKTMAYIIYQKNILLANDHEGGALAIILLLLAMVSLTVFNTIGDAAARRRGGAR
ncbi:ABC transporter permease [Paracoccus onubensis]|uniref:ABC transporter permease n=1 Tax=Paracoccus onubensis TaxID=1675788 RepID=UPI0027315C9D|nr:ABC transporter permease [Paracoccus onubensis]MDP0930305.1 ABC transporter permease [Paracoccus onubensis]